MQSRPLKTRRLSKYVESCTPFTDGNGGYEIKFSDGETIKLYNGAKGEQGEPKIKPGTWYLVIYKAGMIM